MEIVVPDEFKYLYETNANRPVVKVPNAVLRETAALVEVITPEIRQLVDTMKSWMKLANGVGLAAPQAGKLHRVIVIAPGGENAMAMINPIITETEGEEIGQEGCLSIPGLYGDVKRAFRIKVEAQDLKGIPYEYEMEGMAARIVQHEIDHLDGILFTDKVDLATLHWMHPDEGADE